MANTSFAGASAALSAVEGITDIFSGYAQSAEDKFNASLYTDQASALAVQGSIEQGQFKRYGAKMLSKQTAVAGAAGLEPTGSVAAVMLDSQTQINTDMAIAKYNNTMAINAANAKAKDLKIKASQAVFSGYSSAFSDLLKGASAYGAYTTPASGGYSFAAGGSFSNTSFTGQ
jgi:hypothetical protein